MIDMPTVSIVIPTYARLAHLKRCLASIRANVTVSHEMIVVGGGDDGTPEWLWEQPDVRFIPETRREGAARAVDRGMRAANGTYVMWINDDAYPLPGTESESVLLQICSKVY